MKKVFRLTCIIVRAQHDQQAKILMILIENGQSCCVLSTLLCSFHPGPSNCNMSTKSFNTEAEGDTSSSKRSPRKRKIMDTTGDDVDEDDRKRSKSDGQGKRKRGDGESETVVALSDSESDFDPDDDDSKAKPSPKRSRTTTQEADTDNACPHCHKVFQSRLGLKYHVKNKVCQRDESVQPVRRRGKAKANVSGKKRTRGKLEDRTCPNCKFVFTSVLGLQYHLSKFRYDWSILPRHT